MAITETTGFTRAWQDWRAERERSLTDVHGWLSITHLHWLDEQPRGYEGSPGHWHQHDGTAVLALTGGEQVVVDGAERSGELVFDLVNSGPGQVVEVGDRHVEVARRGGDYIVRVRDPKAPALAAWKGVPAYDPDPAGRLSGRFIPSEQPRDVTVGAVVDRISHVYASPGQVEFTHGGEIHRLTAFYAADGGFSVLFTDATSGVTTYAANRQISIPAPDADGSVTVDFNRAVNLPCAFTDLATCPLPPAENRLPFAVEAGERIPYERAA